MFNRYFFRRLKFDDHTTQKKCSKFECKMRVLSKGRYMSIRNRAATNKDHARVSLAMFLKPDEAAIVGSAEELVDDQHPPLH
ncbi:hypothetical protein Nepgr_011406 [Nepenthes gracilis]|uniref:Uncharacterized protein n=1 Tax=Nepenthes gracilis TaxID=150966 RepID=A0AAD3SF44_NEPGR|nr:hypothetical protein Nepgr_011406 [Nepenthes gracilis]